MDDQDLAIIMSTINAAAKGPPTSLEPSGGEGPHHPSRTGPRQLSSSYTTDYCSSVATSSVGITYANQSSLPRLPIPPLEETMARFPPLLKALQTTKELEMTRKVCDEFLKGDGAKLQELLIQYEEEGRQSGILGSYVEEFWNDSYLAPDCSLVLNLNPFFVLEEGPDPDHDRNQLGRASSLVYASLLFVSTLKRQELTPDSFRGKALCMDQFQSLFGSCRIPVLDNKDYVEVDPNSNHVVVLVKNRMYYFQGLWPEQPEQQGDASTGSSCYDDALPSQQQDRAVMAVSRNDIFDILTAIVQDVEQQEAATTMTVAAEESAKCAVGVLTTLPRKEWARARYWLTKESKHNQQVLKVIDSALFVLVLDDYIPANVHQNAENMLHGSYRLSNDVGNIFMEDDDDATSSILPPAHLRLQSSAGTPRYISRSNRSLGASGSGATKGSAIMNGVGGSAIMANGISGDHGNGSDLDALLSYQMGTCTNRWYDKLQIIVCQNGSAGVNFEHSAIDGHTALRFVSDIFAQTIIEFAQSITKTIYGIGRIPSVLEAPLKRAVKEDRGVKGKKKSLDIRPKRLTFDLTPVMEDKISRAEAKLGDEVVSSDVRVLEFKEFGKSFVVSHKMSPDSFVQMTIAVAYYRLYGKVASQYEPVLTKQFLHGRTEAMRSCTPKASRFCELWCSRTASRNEKLDALREAVGEHSSKVKECAAGKGVERHLFALKCIAEKHNIGMNGDGGNGSGTASSFFSSDAWTTLNHTVLSTSNCGNPSLRLFGFGPVVADGFGIGYIIKDTAIHFTISSKSRQTDRYKNVLHRVLRDVKYALGNATKQVKVQMSPGNNNSSMSENVDPHKKPLENGDSKVEDAPDIGNIPSNESRVFYSEGFDEYDKVADLPPPPPPPTSSTASAAPATSSETVRAATEVTSSDEASSTATTPRHNYPGRGHLHSHKHRSHSSVAHHGRGGHGHGSPSKPRGSFYLASVKPAERPSLDRETLESVGDLVLETVTTKASKLQHCPSSVSEP